MATNKFPELKISDPLYAAYSQNIKDMTYMDLASEQYTFHERIISDAIKHRNSLLQQVFEHYCLRLPCDINESILHQLGYAFVKEKDDIMWYSKHGVRCTPKFKIESKIDTSRATNIMWKEEIIIVEI